MKYLLWGIIFALNGGAGLLYRMTTLTDNCQQFSNKEVFEACSSANLTLWIGVCLLVCMSMITFVYMKHADKKSLKVKDVE